MAAQINMYENNASLNIEPVDHVIVGLGQVYMNTIPHPCSSYLGFPDKVYGDVYECVTTKEKVVKALGDDRLNLLSDRELAQYIYDSKKTFECDLAKKPSLVQYKGYNVYWFSGPMR